MPAPVLLTRSAWPAALLAVALGVAAPLAVPAAAAAQTAAVLYQRAQTREAAARTSPTATNLRAAAGAYETVVLRYPRSGFCDDALWKGAQVARVAWEKFQQEADRKTATRLLTWLRKEYPTSAFAKQVPAQVTALSQRPAPARPPTPAAASASGPAATIRSITRSDLPKGDRVTIELDREVVFSSERIVNPERVFFDLRNTQFDSALATTLEAVAGSRLATLRVGRPDAQTTRVVLELAGAPRHSVFSLYHPYRVVVDLESDTPGAGPAAPPSSEPARGPAAPPAVVTVPMPSALPPAAPAATSGGDYSLARQLGLGISRIVIDAGHGGHDPGAQANGVVESELVLDIALRVETLLKKQAGIDVVLTRRTQEFIPLEERTAIANREGADLFLSIHANASRRVAAKGVETYFLNFATNPEAEAVAARENAGSRTSMGKLPQLVQQIALHDKMKESRELAQIVQTNMIRALRPQNKAVVDLGVKQAPFVVLIGAQMPSVLAEISFVTNKAEASLLKKQAYRQRIAQALADAVLKYQTSLKKVTTTAAVIGR
ncbi:MAG: N-acetylmuramoyl-L-alanine amidase [Acidobacteria bacterium]|nr:N-acetylmuramoyl-L-alanine amidase [Acidobacteriota bacterium]